MHKVGSTETLFTNPSPVATGYKTQAQDDFSYMNAHADHPVIAARKLLEEWFRNYPRDGKKDLARRFRSALLSQHQGAFWELYLHELFRKMGFDVESHPRSSDSPARPDLLLTKGDTPLCRG